MKVTSRAGRRLAAGVSLACAAILLPTAALAASGAPAARGSAAAPARPAVAACRNAGTEVWNAQEGDGALGTIFYEIELSNVGHHACTLFGYPGVSEINAQGHEVGLPATHHGRRFQVTIEPGGTAHFVLAVIAAGAKCNHPVNGSTLRVFPPGQFVSQLLLFPNQMCPGRSTMSVDAVHAGTGIPFFSLN
jgi:hypothetical protein